MNFHQQEQAYKKRSRERGSTVASEHSAQSPTGPRGPSVGWGLGWGCVGDLPPSTHPKGRASEGDATAPSRRQGGKGRVHSLRPHCVSGPGIPSVRDGKRGSGMLVQNCVQLASWEVSPQTWICTLHHPGTRAAGSSQAGTTQASARVSL